MKILVNLTLLLGFFAATNCFAFYRDSLAKYEFGASFKPSIISTDLNAVTFEGVEDEFDAFYANGFSVFGGVDYKLFEHLNANSSFLRQSTVYIELGADFFSAGTEKTTFVGKHFLLGELDDVYLKNKLDASFFIPRLSFGMKTGELIPKLRGFAGFSAGYIASSAMEATTDLADERIEFADPKPNTLTNNSDNFNSLKLDFNLGAQYKIWEPEERNISADAFMAASLGFTDLIGKTEFGGDPSLGLNSIELGVRVYFPIKKDTLPKDTIVKPPATPTIKASYQIKNNNTNANTIQVKKCNTKIYYIRNPYVFYENNEDVQPKRNYRIFQKRDKLKFENNIENGGVIPEDFLDYHNNILNYIGYDAYNNSNIKINVVYPSGRNNQETYLLRANFIKKYFYDIWDIRKNRINLRKGNVLSASIKIDASQTNQIDQFDSDANFETISDQIVFKIESNYKIASCSLKVNQPHYSGSSHICVDTVASCDGKNCVIVLDNLNEYVKDQYDKLTFFIYATLQNGTKIRTEGKIVIRFIESSETLYRIAGLASDVRFAESEIKKLLQRRNDFLIYAPLPSIAEDVARQTGITNYKYISNQQIKNDFHDTFEIEFK